MNPQEAQQKEVHQIKVDLNKNIQILRESLRQVKNLRSTVDQVFTFLNKGFVDDYTSQDDHKNQQNFLRSLQNRLFLFCKFDFSKVLKVKKTASFSPL